MSIYNTSISGLSIIDVQELLFEATVENVRLGFKQEIPGRDEMLKKLSSGRVRRKGSLHADHPPRG
jgi:hypothetical protein